MFQALELLYLLFLAANITFIFELDIHLLRHSLWQGFPLRIKRRNQIIVEFRTLDELSKRIPVFNGVDCNAVRISAFPAFAPI